ncbi:MAG: protein BatD, partial [Pseudoxanthomonas sp.]
VLAKLADPAQREAVEALRRARWAGGDGPRARELLRRAFAHGPAWKIARGDARAGELPPLYPPSR